MYIKILKLDGNLDIATAYVQLYGNHCSVVVLAHEAFLLHVVDQLA